MTTELAQFLKKASDHCGSQECEVREDYSGSGMCGRTTVGVVVTSIPELLLSVVQFIKETVEFADHGEQYAENLPEISDMASLRTDNMGHSIILY
jgi:hypothetical protein